MQTRTSPEYFVDTVLLPIHDFLQLPYPLQVRFVFEIIRIVLHALFQRINLSLQPGFHLRLQHGSTIVSSSSRCSTGLAQPSWRTSAACSPAMRSNSSRASVSISIIVLSSNTKTILHNKLLFHSSEWRQNLQENDKKYAKNSKKDCPNR